MAREIADEVDAMTIGGMELQRVALLVSHVDELVELLEAPGR